MIEIVVNQDQLVCFHGTHSQKKEVLFEIFLFKDFYNIDMFFLC